jgi:hypothetical protein
LIFRCVTTDFGVEVGVLVREVADWTLVLPSYTIPVTRAGFESGQAWCLGPDSTDVSGHPDGELRGLWWIRSDLSVGRYLACLRQRPCPESGVGLW